MRAFHGVTMVAACVLAAGAVALAAGPAKADALADAGLKPSAGGVYVLDAEAPVLEQMKALRQNKLDADKEYRVRHALELQLAAKRKVIHDGDKEWHTLENRLSLVQDVSVHNRIVTRMNRIVVDVKEAFTAEKELEDKTAKTSITAKAKFVDDVAALAPKAEAVMARYQSLAADGNVKAALAKATISAGAKATLGPSAEFATAAADLKKWQSETESEAIPMREEHGGHVVDVLVNGEHFLMGVDTGASCVSLSFEAAKQLDMHPGEKDPTVHVQLADGNLIEGKEMTLKTVRVGRFTAEDVRCVVMPENLPNAPLLLGGSFLNRFIVKLDPSTHELRLTEIKGSGGASSAGGK